MDKLDNNELMIKMTTKKMDQDKTITLMVHLRDNISLTLL